MADDLDPAAVERLSAEWFARAQSWGAMAGPGDATGALEREKAAVRRDMAMSFAADLDDLVAGRTGTAWLAEHDAQVAARAWDEGRAATREGDVCGDPACCPPPDANPYRGGRA